MKMVKKIIQGFGIIMGLIVLYLLIVTFIPGIRVSEQPLEHGKHLTTQVDIKPSGAKRDVSFAVKGTSLHAWLFLPENLSAPVPCIIMAHGFGLTKDMGLESYAVRYQKAGFAVLIFDYRHFGKSGGQPRQLIWIPYQLEDWLAAIKYVRNLKEIDSGRIALWGTSFSGGHVIVTAAKDNQIACVVAQCPALDGRALRKMLFKR
jgi:cephalosporin-C deacetylase-like acetyl esterase